MRATASGGFTLIEVAGAFFMTVLVLFLVFGIFSENGRQRGHASELLRVETTASGALDLIARDLEAAVFLARPGDVDPRDHPWIFLAEDAGDLGATRIRFQTQNVSRDRSGLHSAGWADVAYFLTEEEDEDEVGFAAGQRYTLWRWRASRLSSESSRRWPDVDTAGAARVAEGLANFGIRLFDEAGGNLDEWDSTFGTGETPLPVAAEIQLTLYENARPGETDPGVFEVPGRVHTRSVAIPMHRALDIAALVSSAANAPGASCETVADCADIDDEWFVDLVNGDCDGDTELCDLLNAASESCWSDAVSGWPFLADEAPEQCEAFE